MTQAKQPSVALVWSERWSQAPAVSQAASLQPLRLLHAYQVMASVGVLGWDGVSLVPPDESLGALERLAEFHEPDYCEVVAQLDNQLGVDGHQGFGFSLDGTMPFEGMKEVATGFVAAARTAVQLSLEGQRTKVISLAGEQYHAQAGQAEAGHIFNDVALALLDARAAGKKVAFINLEAEHAKVIQDLFFEDSTVLTISLHEGADFLYPRTGKVEEIGRGEGHGFNINLPMPPGAGDAELLKAFCEVALPVLNRFNPNLVLLLAGSSAHVAEPLAHLRLTSHGYQQVLAKVMGVPHLVLLGGAGTNWHVTARLWTLALATLAEQESQAKFLHDKPLSHLPASMQAYVSHQVQQQLTEAQQLLFPLWQLPLPATIGEEPPFATPSVVAELTSHHSGYKINHISHKKKDSVPPSQSPDNEQREPLQPKPPEQEKASSHKNRTRRKRNRPKRPPLKPSQSPLSADLSSEASSEAKEGQAKAKASANGEADQKASQQSKKQTRRSKRRRRRKKSSQKSRKDNQS